MKKFPTTIDDINSCPYCGGEILYTKDWVEGSSITKFNFELDSEAVDNTEMYEGLQHTSGNRLYCYSCNKFIGNLNTKELSSGVKTYIQKHAKEEEGIPVSDNFSE